MAVVPKAPVVALVTLALGVPVSVGAVQRSTTGGPAKPAAAVACAAELGTGVRTKRQFCDIIISKDMSDSISITLPPHKGPATLSFDLHNRFGMPEAGAPPDRVYARHEAVLTVIASGGTALSRLVVEGEYRGPASLFDRITGGSGPGGTKAIGPGAAEPVKVTIPAAVSAVGIVGVKLTVTTIRGTNVFDSPGRPVAIASNFKVEFTPR